MRVLAPILAGYVIWSAGFLAIYALQATGCSQGWDGLRTLLLAAAGVTAAANLGAVVWAARMAASFGRRVALVTSVTALVATALTFSGVLWMPLCG